MRALLRKIRQILRDRKTRRIFTRLVSTVAAIVVFVTTYALVLPAITMESEAACGIEAHQHDQSCFTDDLVCEIPESSGHVHDDSCYQKVLTCGKEVHTHSAACYHVDTASQAATEAIAVASTESAAAAETENAMGDTDSLNAPVENNEPETGLDSSTENSVIEGSLDGSTDNSVPGGDLNPLTDEVSGSERGAWTSTEAAADATASTAASTEASVGATAGITATPESTAGETATTATSTGAADATSASAGYVPVLDELNFNTLLNKNTGIYYSRIADSDSALDNENDGADAASNTEDAQVPATWNRIDKHTELKESDNLRLYLAYTIPAGSLNETNQTARYTLPGNIHLTDEQVVEINTTVNGIAGQYVSYDTLEILDQEMYGKYLGVETIEGTRTPSDDLNEYLANNEGQEFISATVKVEKALDENTGLLQAQDLVFTFAPYTIQKNQHQYDSEGKPTKAGEEVNGWLAIDISTEQIDWEKADDGAQTADIIFVEKDKKSDIKEISTELRLVGIEADSDVNTKKVADADSTDSTNPAATDNKQDGTKDSEAADGELDKEAEKEQVNYPDVSFDDSITVTGGSLSTDTGAVSGDAGMAAETEITVHVEADKNTFPEGTTMILSAVPDEQMTTVAEAVEGAVDAPKTMGFHAVDISFRDVKGNEIEPLKPIRVSMTSDAIKRAVEDKSTAPVVVHVSDIAADVPAEERNTDNGDSKPAAVADEYTDDGDSEPAAAADEGADDGEAANVTDSDEVEGAADQHIAEPSETSADQAPDNSPDTPATPAATIIETDTVTKENNGDTLTFDAEAFSVYAIVYTVDFHYEINGKMYDFSIPGGGFVSLEHVVEVLGIATADENSKNGAENAENGAENENDFVGKVLGVDVSGENGTAYEDAIKLNEVEVSEATKKFVADVESVVFSSPELVWVGKVDAESTVGGLKEANGLEVEYSADLTEEQIAEINEQTVEAGDWALISVHPFTSEETLTVTMKNGDQWTVEVTDASIQGRDSIGDGTYVIYYMSGNDYYVLRYDLKIDKKTAAQMDTLDEDYLWKFQHNVREINGHIIRDDFYIINKNNQYMALDGSVENYLSNNEARSGVYETEDFGGDYRIFGWNFRYGERYISRDSSHKVRVRGQANSNDTVWKLWKQIKSNKFTVKTEYNNVYRGTVSGYDTEGARISKQPSYQSYTAEDTKNNMYEISANPGPGYRFKEWRLGDNVLTGYTETIGAGTLNFPDNNMILTAVFEKIEGQQGFPDYSGIIDAWKDQNLSNPLEMDKTAKVVDYDNRIYEIDLSAKAEAKNITNKVELTFVTDISRSMYFPAELTAQDDYDYDVSSKDDFIAKLNAARTARIAQNNSADGDDVYYLIAEPEGSATVYAVRYDGTNWRYIDASYDVRTYGKTGVKVDTNDQWLVRDDSNKIKGWQYLTGGYNSSDPKNKLNQDGKDGNKLYLDNNTKRKLDGNIYVATDVRYRLDYLQQAVDIASDAVYSLNPSAKIGLATFANLAIDTLEPKEKADYGELITTINNVSPSGGTNQKAGLEAVAEFWEDKTPTDPQRVVILVTDGAPNYQGTPKVNWSDIQGAAKDLYDDKGAIVHTVGISLANVTGAVSGMATTAQQGGGGLSFNAENGTALVQHILSIVETLLTDVSYVGTMEDMVDPAFYPVTVNGDPITPGYYDEEGNPIKGDNIDQIIQGYNANGTAYCEWINENGVWRVKWYNFVIGRGTTASPATHQSILIKAKEDFLGGNKIPTNQGTAQTTATQYIENSTDTPKNLEVIRRADAETPYVNVDELHLTENSTEWTVYQGTDVTPEEQLEKLFEQILIKQVVKENGTTDDIYIADGQQCWYERFYPLPESAATTDEAAPDQNYATIPLTQILAASDADVFSDMLDNLKTSNEVERLLDYQGFGHFPGYIRVKIEKDLKTGVQDALGKAPGTHTTDLAASAAETYKITVTYEPKTSGAHDEYENTTPSGKAGKITGQQGDTGDAVKSENNHVINVFVKKLLVEKRDKDTGSLITDKSAAFTLFKSTGGAVPTKASDVVSEDGTVKAGYAAVGTLETNTTGANVGKTDAYDLAPLVYGMFTNDTDKSTTYYLVETQQPNGYLKSTSVWPVTLSISENPTNESGAAAVASPLPYDWTQTAILTVGDQASADDSNTATVTFSVDNEKGVDIEILKIDEKGDPLDLATFRLQIKEGSYQNIKDIKVSPGSDDIKYPSVGGLDENSSFVSGTEKVKITKLPDGNYKLVEDSTHDGYIIKQKEIEFTISSGVISGTDIEGTVKFEEADGTTLALITITNEPGAALPNTGGSGTTIIYILGIMLTGLAGTGLVMRRRRQNAA